MNDLNNLIKKPVKCSRIFLVAALSRYGCTVIMVLVDLPKDKLSSYRRKVSDLSFVLDLKYDVLLSIKLQDKETFQKFAEVLPFFKNIIREGKRVL